MIKVMIEVTRIRITYIYTVYFSHMRGEVMLYVRLASVIVYVFSERKSPKIDYML